MPQANTAAPYRNGGAVLQIAIAGVAVLTSLGALFWQAANPKGDVSQLRYDIRDDMRRQEERFEREVRSIRTDEKNLLSISEHKEFTARKDKDTDVLRDEINRLRAEQVTRSEHQQHWNEIAERFATFRGLLEEERKAREIINAEMRKEFGSTWTAADQMKNLQDQIKDLQKRLDAWKPVPVTPTTAVLADQRMR